MFSPINFPVRAFYVTAALNVRECEVAAREIGLWFSTDTGVKHAFDLFEDRLGAISEAGKRLSKMHDRYVKAGERWTKCRENVEALQKGGAQ